MGSVGSGEELFRNNGMGVGTYLLSVCGLHMSSVVWLSLCVLFNKEQIA